VRYSLSNKLKILLSRLPFIGVVMDCANGVSVDLSDHYDMIRFIDKEIRREKLGNQKKER